MRKFGTRLTSATLAAALSFSPTLPVMTAANVVPAAAAVTALGLGLIPSSSHAVTVWDPTNFVQNLITATNSVLTEANTYRSMVEQTKQTMAMARQVSNLGGLAELAGMSEELALFQDMYRTSMQLYNTLQESQQVYANLQSQWGASNFTWENFLRGQSAVQTGRVNSMIMQFENAGRSVERVAQRRQVLLQKAQEAGVNESMMQITQVVSGQLDMIAGQNQQVVQMMANNMAVDAAKEQDRISAEDFSRAAQRARQQKLLNSATTLH